MRILVVEDEARMATYLEKCLVAEGFDVDVAGDGELALERALAGGYDAITLDIMLPKMNGYAVCRELRKAGVDVPILMLTAKDGEYDEADALDIGADDFLRKPFSVVVLVARLRALLRRGEARSATLTFSDLSLSPKSKSVSRDGSELELTPREFALMEYFLYNAGNTLSKAQLLEHVWGAGFAGDPNVVEVYVGYLRKKLDSVPGKARIQTVRGRGYRLTED
ncbi:MAG: response regulator transcription factor [Coriobacteriaceae bacterium]|nr:response regulator transcription factor [Coriobacteriaceae bacterium]MDO4891272.1 response regulator transcription factor [Coriobacteriaceae bacterium]